MYEDVYVCIWGFWKNVHILLSPWHTQKLKGRQGGLGPHNLGKKDSSPSVAYIIVNINSKLYNHMH